MTLPAIMTGAARVTQPPSRLPPELDPRGPGRSRPTRGSTGARARPGIARWLRWTAGGSALAVALVLVGGFAAYAYYSGRLGHVSIRLPGQAAPPDSDGPAQDFLIVGSDTRDFAGGQAFQASPGSADYVTGQRSDTVMLVHLPAGNTKATLVSFPRDSYVQIPAHPDEKGRPQAPYPAKLNEAFSVGGPALLVQLVENLSGLRIDHYVAVDFAGFKHMVDALGGVTLCVNTTRHDPDSGDMLTKGVHQNVTGDDALAFVRDRKGPGPDPRPAVLPRPDADEGDQRRHPGQPAEVQRLPHRGHRECHGRPGPGGRQPAHPGDPAAAPRCRACLLRDHPDHDRRGDPVDPRGRAERRTDRPGQGERPVRPAAHRHRRQPAERGAIAAGEDQRCTGAGAPLGVERVRAVRAGGAGGDGAALGGLPAVAVRS